MRVLAEHWYVVALAAAALFGGWIALGRPGAPPDEDETLLVRAELESALRAGTPSRVRELALSCGALDGADRSVSSLSEPSFELAALRLEPMPWLGDGVAPGRARLTVRGAGGACEIDVTFRYAWRRTGDVKTTAHGSHTSTHGVASKRAIVRDLAFTKR